MIADHDARAIMRTRARVYGGSARALAMLGAYRAITNRGHRAAAARAIRSPQPPAARERVEVAA